MEKTPYTLSPQQYDRNRSQTQAIVQKNNNLCIMLASNAAFFSIVQDYWSMGEKIFKLKITKYHRKKYIKYPYFDNLWALQMENFLKKKQAKIFAAFVTLFSLKRIRIHTMQSV